MTSSLESDVTRPLYVLLILVSGPGQLHVHVGECKSSHPPCFRNCWLTLDTAHNQKRVKKNGSLNCYLQEKNENTVEIPRGTSSAIFCSLSLHIVYKTVMVLLYPSSHATLEAAEDLQGPALLWWTCSVNIWHLEAKWYCVAKLSAKLFHTTLFKSQALTVIPRTEGRFCVYTFFFSSPNHVILCLKTNSSLLLKHPKKANQLLKIDLNILSLSK